MTASPVFVWGLSGKKYTDPAEYDVGTLLGPAVKLVALPTNNTAFAPTRKVWADSNTTADVTDAQGNLCVGFPLFENVELNISLTKITNLSNGSANVFGGY